MRVHNFIKHLPFLIIKLYNFLLSKLLNNITVRKPLRV